MRQVLNGAWKSPEYLAWRAMINRCQGIKNRRKTDGKVCARWKSFLAFLADMGPRPSPQHSLCRSDHKKPYGPKNCYWTTKHARASRRSVFYTHDGETRIQEQWAKRLPIASGAIRNRIARGWTVAAAVSTPSRRT